ncbi:MAG: NUDIX hydrolase [Coriobacteriales bacterium]|jgi:ADP-ribose pyrophosphatase YjhB (NUDIX family)|nr:NUDIX hydrolase [Coriobacteriales bacterium]
MVVRDKDGLSEQEFLAQYDASAYERPSVTADIVLFAAPGDVFRGALHDTPGGGLHGALHGELHDALPGEPDDRHKLPTQDLELLLIRRGGHPYLGRWALPGGFLDPNETLDQTARRELKEETGVDDTASDVCLQQLHTFSKPGRDPRGWTVTGAYIALADRSKLTLKAGDDAADAAWFKMALTRGEGQTWHLELTGAGEVLRATFTEIAETETNVSTAAAVTTTATATVSQVLPPLIATTSDLAFDHANIIACALQKLWST